MFAFLTNRYAIVALLLLVVVYRLVCIHFTGLPLFYDEAHYYFWSLSPEFGYFSKPPVVAWLIQLSTAVLPVSEFSVKLFAPVLYGASALLVMAIGTECYDRSTGALAALLFISMPLVSFNSLFITTDAPLLFCWSLASWFAIRAIKRNQWIDWLATGIATGFGLLSKYTMVLLPLSLFLYLLTSREHRQLLGSPRSWLGLVLAVLIYLPNLWWNQQHAFISFQHTQEISQLDRSLLHPSRLFEFIGGQLLAFGIVAMFFFVKLALQKQRYLHQPTRFLLFLTLPGLLGFCLLSLLSRANQNWAAPVYVSASVLAAHMLLGRAKLWSALALGLNVLVMSGFYHYHSVQSLAGIEINRRNDPYHRLLGWRELGNQLSHWQQRYPQAQLLAEKRKLLAYFGFYSTPRFAGHVAIWNPHNRVSNQYHITANLSDADTGPYLFVSEHPLPAATLSRFRIADLLARESVSVYPNLQRKLYIYYVEGFEGYDSSTH